MATDVGVGDLETPFVVVEPADTDTVAVLTVHPPPAAGSSYTVTATAGDLEPIEDSEDLQQRWEADEPVAYTAPGLWVLHWDVTGTGEGDEDFEVYVVRSPVAGGPTWLPGRSRIANYVTHRTLARNPAAIRNSQTTLALTFDSTTTPTGLQCDRLIADGGAWVAMRVSPLHDTMQDAAAVVVSLYTAAAIERQFKSDEQSLQRANDMEKRMDALLKDLIEANNIANDSGDYGVDLVYPQYAFPPAYPRWDCARYW